jgi:UDP-glucose 4-epimerase
MKVEKVLLFGGTGTLGLKLVDKLNDSGYDVELVTRKLGIELKSNYIHKDIFDFSIVDVPSDISHIIYLAQSNNFRDFPNSAEDIAYINTHFPLRLASWARELGIKSFIYASSGGVYNKSNEALKEFFNVDANIENGFYIGSKLSAEILLRPFSEFFENFIILRPFFIFSESQNKEKWLSN